MALRLTRKLRARLAHASEALLSAGDHPSPAAWRDHVRSALGELIGADFVGVRLPAQLVAPSARDEAPPALERAYRQALYHVAGTPYLDLVPPDGAIMITTVLAAPPLPAGLICRRERGRLGHAALETLRLIGPAFRAGVATCMRVSQRRPLLCAALDGLAEGAALVDADGRILHRNHALVELMNADPEADRLLRAADGILTRLRRRHAPGETPGYDPAPPGAAAHVETAAGHYRLFGTLLEPDAGGGSAILLVVEPRAQRLPGAATLRRRYGLSRREAEVAILLAQGRRNTHVASTLGISPPTARHHTEMVMAKLGSRSRAEVGAVLLGA